MAYYGGDPYARPPSDRPPYDRPPYQQQYQQPPYDRPPYDRGYSGPPPGARPPPGPPPPLPPGWHQEWEPNARRAFWVEDATGRPQWEPPFGPGMDYSRGPPGPPEPQGGYYNAPPGPPPGAYDQRGPGGYDYQQQQQQPEQKSNTGKYIAAGLAGVAIGGLGGAFIEHEIDENNEEDDERRAYEDGREDQFQDDW
ncbi:hypothetical protein N7490_009665 [Penicillium lividum]|nr:hypothetical protein N7490_009665 [Penicillium lividum]